MNKSNIPNNVLSLHKGKNYKAVREPNGSDPIGLPPERLNNAQKQLFNEIVSISDHGVLLRADTLAVEMAARLLYQIRGLEVVDGAVVPIELHEIKLFHDLMEKFFISKAKVKKIIKGDYLTN